MVPGYPQRPLVGDPAHEVVAALADPGVAQRRLLRPVAANAADELLVRAPVAGELVVGHTVPLCADMR